MVPMSTLLNAETSTVFGLVVLSQSGPCATYKVAAKNSYSDENTVIDATEILAQASEVLHNAFPMAGIDLSISDLLHRRLHVVRDAHIGSIVGVYMTHLMNGERDVCSLWIRRSRGI